MTKIPITQISSEDLLKLLEDNNVEEQVLVPQTNDIVEFISVFNLKQGEESIKIDFLYNKIYLKWSKNKVTKISFLYNLKLYFGIKYNSRNNFVLLNLDNNQLLKKTLNYINKKPKNNKSYKIHFEKYLLKYDINKGGFFVKDSILYNIYDKWMYKYKKRNPLGFRQFVKFCKLYFKPNIKLINGHNWFGLDKSIIKHLSKDNINEMRNHAKETNKT